jgi:tetratricopeptide (TPR) repeat protein
LKLGELDAAIVSFEKVISCSPDFAEAHNNRGNALLELNQSHPALASFDKAISLSFRAGSNWAQKL